MEGRNVARGVGVGTLSLVLLGFAPLPPRAENESDREGTWHADICAVTFSGIGALPVGCALEALSAAPSFDPTAEERVYRRNTGADCIEDREGLINGDRCDVEHRIVNQEYVLTGPTLRKVVIVNPEGGGRLQVILDNATPIFGSMSAPRVVEINGAYDGLILEPKGLEGYRRLRVISLSIAGEANRFSVRSEWRSR